MGYLGCHKSFALGYSRGPERGFFSACCAIVERDARRTRVDEVVGVIVVAHGTGLGLFELGVFDFLYLDLCWLGGGLGFFLLVLFFRGARVVGKAV